MQNYQKTILFVICVTLVSLYWYNGKLWLDYSFGFLKSKKESPSLTLHDNTSNSKIYPLRAKEEKTQTNQRNFSTIQTLMSTLNPSKETSSFVTFHSVEKYAKELQEALSQANSKYYIVMFPGDWHPPNNIIPSRCGNCELTYNERMATDIRTKALVFHFNRINKKTFPKNRRPDQYYVWFSWESLANLGIMHDEHLAQYKDFFNLTMTYRRDSDIYFPYYIMPDILKTLQSKGSGNLSKDLDNVIKDKRKMALWVVKNCDSTPGTKTRMTYSTKLIEAGLDLDRRGPCFSRHAMPPRTGAHRIDHDYVSKYKFYMAFENTIYSSDYITEKFFENALYNDAVPVVMGAKKSDYEKIAPKHSFIHVDDFETPKKLVEYLHYLDGNETAYREYFAWRLSDVEEMPNYERATGLCQLCRIIHGINIDNIYHPWYGEKHSDIPLFGFSNKPRVVSTIREWFN